MFGVDGIQSFLEVSFGPFNIILHILNLVWTLCHIGLSKFGDYPEDIFIFFCTANDNILGLRCYNHIESFN